DAGMLHLRDQRRVILLTWRDGFVHGLLHALVVQALLGFVGKALTVGGLVVQDGNFLALVLLHDVVAGDNALLVVTAADAEDILVATLGKLRVGRSRRDLQDVLFLVDVGSGDRRARAEVADHGSHPLLRRAVRDSDGLLRIALVVAEDQLDLLTIVATRGVKAVDRRFGAALHLLAEAGELAGDRTMERNLHLRRRGTGEKPDSGHNGQTG